LIPIAEADTRCAGLVARLAAEAEAALASILPRRSRCALISFPNHDNAGDSAIWVGEKVLLRRLDVTVTYTCDVRTYSAKALARVLDEDVVILLHGGGNFGDIWPRQQALRERVLEDFPGARVVQLPQSIHFQDERKLEHCQALVQRHGDLVLLVREQQSLAVARSFDAKVLLCPDLAFVLGSLAFDERRSTPILWLARTDRESRFPDAAAPDAGISKLDWIGGVVRDEPQWSREAGDALALNQELTRRIEEDPAAASELTDKLATTYDVLAAQRLERGCRILLRGEVIVTDRLHGHILSLLLGLPNVIMDNNYGKIRSVYETWTRGCPLVSWAESPSEALAIARQLAA
jgi:exopolysaccharide biosynthesis protein PssK